MFAAEYKCNTTCENMHNSLHFSQISQVTLFGNADNALCVVLATGLCRLSNENVDIPFVAFKLFPLNVLR